MPKCFSSRSAMSGSLGALEWIFVSSPRLATGPEAPHISDGRELGALEIAEKYGNHTAMWQLMNEMK